jgi:transaldolase
VNHHPEHDPLGDLSAAGVAVWLDDLSRELLADGGLESLVADRHVVGVTTNPTIFASALSKGDRYDDQLAALAADGAGTDTAVLAVTTDDVRAPCDILAPVHARTAGLDGCVSIEVDPRLSRDAAATAGMARRLWTTVNRDNLYIKIPATQERLAAITEVISQGISVNVTLIFSLERHRAVMDAYLSGLEQAAEAGRDLAAIRSVASFFISRVDTEVDARLDRIGTPMAARLKGSAAIANARLAYQAHEQLTASERWQRLARLGASPQRPLWVSTGVKNPAYPDTKYVTELVAPGTVNTMPGPTLEAFADHGQVSGNTITGRYHDSRGFLALLAAWSGPTSSPSTPCSTRRWKRSAAWRMRPRSGSRHSAARPSAPPEPSSPSATGTTTPSAGPTPSRTSAPSTSCTRGSSRRTGPGSTAPRNSTWSLRTC